MDSKKNIHRKSIASRPSLQKRQKTLKVFLLERQKIGTEKERKAAEPGLKKKQYTASLLHRILLFRN
ncbi:unnamed protein product, partial [Larinioides sclopetarius]